MIKFDRKIYFDCVRIEPFGAPLEQQQVDGQEFLLSEWEKRPLSDDLRHLAYALATTLHETAGTMMPIEEYGKGEDQEYGEVDPETGQTYYGRGFVQLTWRDNYKKATEKLMLSGANDLELHAERALDPIIAANVMYFGMMEGWFRSGHSLPKYFAKEMDDPYNAREIVNGDKARVPTWSHGMSIGKLIEIYHDGFMEALNKSSVSQTKEGQNATS